MTKKTEGMIGELPRKLKLMNQDWEVIYVSPIPGSEVDCLGKCEIYNNKIYIDTGQSAESMRRVLMHEICHVFFNLTPNSIKDKWEEDIADLFALSIIDLLKNNNLDFIAKSV
jgi:hypothetical protein